MSEETSSLNTESPLNVSESLHDRIAFIGRLGWLAAAILLCTNVITVVAFSMQPTPILASDNNGNVIGTVILNDGTLRGDSEAKADIKRWASAYLSRNSATIWEDAQTAYNHMCPEFQQATKTEWANTGILQVLSELKGVSKVQFVDDYPKLIRNRDRFEAHLKGHIQSGVANPEFIPFEYKIQGKFVLRSEVKSLGLEVCLNEEM